MKTTINDLESAILALTDAGDIRRVINAIREVQSERTANAIATFKRGDKVRFVAKGFAIVGVVDKMNRKTMSLRHCFYERSGVPVPNYRVSPTFCTIVPR